jgi:hypothetical protein
MRRLLYLPHDQEIPEAVETILDALTDGAEIAAGISVGRTGDGRWVSLVDDGEGFVVIGSDGPDRPDPMTLRLIALPDLPGEPIH